MPYLPLEKFRKRVRNEIHTCKQRLDHTIKVTDPTYSKIPVELEVTIKNTPVPVLRKGRLNELSTHKFIILITDQYPYEKPKVIWRTPIFHPNIKLPQDGGEVCTRLLDNWTCHSNLVSFIEGLEILLINPNPKSPWDTNSCTLSAEYFNKNQYTPPAISMIGQKRLKFLNNE